MTPYCAPLIDNGIHPTDAADALELAVTVCPQCPLEEHCSYPAGESSLPVWQPRTSSSATAAA